MAYDAKVLEVMIASPSDVTEERNIVREVVSDWNALNSREKHVALLPSGWETHSSPELSGRAQQLINERIVRHADIMVGIFWQRLGTPTGDSASGTVEEIETHHKAGKPVLLYFSDVEVSLSQVNLEEFSKLQEFKAWAYNEGLVAKFKTRLDFRDQFRRDLQLCLQDNGYIKGLTEIDLSSVFHSALINDPSPMLSEDAKYLLVEATRPLSHNIVSARRSLGGTTFQAGHTMIGQEINGRDAARWQGAVGELREAGLITDLNSKGEIFEVSNEGFTLADTLPD